MRDLIIPRLGDVSHVTGCVSDGLTLNLTTCLDGSRGLPDAQECLDVVVVGPRGHAVGALVPRHPLAAPGGRPGRSAPLAYGCQCGEGVREVRHHGVRLWRRPAVASRPGGDSVDGVYISRLK